MLNRDAVRHITSTVCMIGYTKVPPAQWQQEPTAPHLRVTGTGFLIRPNVVLTNRHVILHTQSDRESNGFPAEHQCIVFLRPVGDEVGVLRCTWDGFVYLKEPELDLAVLRFRHPDSAYFAALRPPTLGDALRLDIGDAVASIGYPYGSNSLERDDAFGVRRVYRVGPILQRGFISAIAPFSTSATVHRLLLDMRSAPGMSGAPIFDPESGVVVAVHDAGFDHVVAHAVPVSNQRVSALLGLFDEHDGTSREQSVPVPLVRRPQE